MATYERYLRLGRELKFGVPQKLASRIAALQLSLRTRDMSQGLSFLIISILFTTERLMLLTLV